MLNSNFHLDKDFSTGINVEHRGKRKIIEVDTNKASFRHIPWHSLGDFGKRKMENLLVLTDTRIPVKVVYL